MSHTLTLAPADPAILDLDAVPDPDGRAVRPGRDTLTAAVTLALRAPSVHNTQPWSWRLSDHTVHLYADESRRLSHADPDSRQLLLSCGAALHHLTVAMRAFGWRAHIRRFPDPADRRHLAAVEFGRARPDAVSIRLARAISRRRSDRRRFTEGVLPRGEAAAIAAAGTAPGVRVHGIDAPAERARLLRAGAADAPPPRACPPAMPSRPPMPRSVPSAIRCCP
ncbi:hypothetical protein GL307_19415, partial [Nocardia seriolae]|nr:hypothetical protein [Nocardia seriolae]